MAFGNMALVMLVSLPLYVVKALRDESRDAVQASELLQNQNDCGICKKDLTEKNKSDCYLLWPEQDGNKSWYLENYPCTGKDSEKSWNIGPCHKKTTGECCAKTCCELGPDQGGTTSETCMKEEEHVVHEPQLQAESCGCFKNKANDTQFQDCHVDSVQGVLDSKYRTCNDDDTRKMGIGTCMEDSLQKCCPKTCCELSKIDKTVQFGLKCPAENVEFELESQSEVIISQLPPQKQEVQVKAVMDHDPTLAISTTPSGIIAHDHQEIMTASTGFNVEENSNAAKVCELVQKELVNQEDKIERSQSKKKKFHTRFNTNVEKKRGEYSEKHCGTAVVFEKDNNEDMVRIKSGAVIKVTGKELKDGDKTDSINFTVNFELYLKSMTGKPYNNGCSWVSATGTCEYVAS